jgi:phosphoribosylamine--glycine ligase
MIATFVANIYKMSGVNVLIIGSGGREHALAWKLSQSPKLGKLFALPGNPGTARLGENIPLSVLDFEGIRTVVLEKNINLVVIGPEEPLVKGLYNFLTGDLGLRNVLVVGPGREGAMLEGSKNFAKAFMQRHGIPTARYRAFTRDEYSEAKKFLGTLSSPYVLKADGLAAGKGVVIQASYEDACASLSEFFSGKFGDAGNVVVIEEYLGGVELSVFVLTDGKSYVILPEAKDYKRVGAGDTGPNTGGMGAVSPVPFATPEFMKKVEETIVKPTISGLASEGIPYCGFIFFGLMNVVGNPFVVEYNARLGDPETQVVLPRIKSDMLELLMLCAAGKMNEAELVVAPQFAATVILASGGYPGSYEKGKAISGLEASANAIIFHAGTTSSGSMTLTAGGRVLACTGTGESMEDALASSYCAANAITFESKYFRSDIGMDVYPKS